MKKLKPFRLSKTAMLNFTVGHSITIILLQYKCGMNQWRIQNCGDTWALVH